MEVSLRTAATRRIRLPEVEGKHPPLPAGVCVSALVCVLWCVCPGGAQLMLVRLTWNAGTFGGFTSASLSIGWWLLAAGCDEPLQQIVNFSVYCGVLSLGEKTGLCWGCPSLCSPSFLQASLVCMTPANEPNTKTTPDFPWEGPPIRVSDPGHWTGTVNRVSEPSWASSFGLDGRQVTNKLT